MSRYLRPSAERISNAQWEVHAGSLDKNGQPEHISACLAFEFNGARYHVWRNTNGTLEDTLYKNPPASIRSGDLGYYETRRISLSNSYRSAQLVALGKAAAGDFGAILALWVSHQRYLRDERAKAEVEAVRMARVQASAPELLEAAKVVLAALRGRDLSYLGLFSAYTTLNDVVRKAEGEQ